MKKLRESAQEILVLGGGVGGTLCANLIAKRSGGKAHVTVVDATGTHVFQPAGLAVGSYSATTRLQVRARSPGPQGDTCEDEMA